MATKTSATLIKGIGTKGWLQAPRAANGAVRSTENKPNCYGVRFLSSTNKQAPARGQRVIDVTVYKRIDCGVITRVRNPRFSKVTCSPILAKSSRITVFGTHAACHLSLLKRPLSRLTFPGVTRGRFRSEQRICFRGTIYRKMRPAPVGQDGKGGKGKGCGKGELQKI